MCCKSKYAGSIMDTKRFLKWCPSGCALALEFSKEWDFPGSNIITADHVGKTGFLLENAHLCGKRTSSEQSSEMCMRYQ
jgi:hypothetical protein